LKKTPTFKTHLDMTLGDAICSAMAGGCAVWADAGEGRAWQTNADGKSKTTFVSFDLTGGPAVVAYRAAQHERDDAAAAAEFQTTKRAMQQNARQLVKAGAPPLPTVSFAG
jgi:sugar lactone lactonase YvrE